MKDIKERFLHIRPRSWYLWLMIIIFMASFAMPRHSRTLMAYLMCPLGFAVFLYELLAKKIKWNRCAVLILLTSVLFVLSNLRSGNWSKGSIFTLTIACFSMLLFGIVPVDMDAHRLRREFQVASCLVLFSMLPIIILAVASVFLARPVSLFRGFMNIGIQSPGQISGRIYTHAHPNIVANYAMLAIAAAVYLLYNRPPKGVRVLLGATIVVLLMGVAHCQSRSVNIALGAGVGALAFRFVRERCGGGKRGVLLGALAWAAATCITIMGINGLFSLDVRIAMRLHPSLAQESAISRAVTDGEFDVTSNGRDIIWKGGLDYLIHHPADLLFGMGAGDIMQRFYDYLPHLTYFAHLHNSFLEALARGGVPMLVCLLGTLVLGIKPTWRALTVPTDPAERGIPAFAMIIVMLLLHSLTEPFLFTAPLLSNILFFYSLGRVMHASGGDGADNATIIRKIPKKPSANG